MGAAGPRPGRPAGKIGDALDALQDGRMIVVCDGSEGDLVTAAQFATADAVNFMTHHGRGLVRLALTAARCDRLGLMPIPRRGEGRSAGDFTVSIEAREGIETGISAADRARTIQAAIRPEASAGDLVQPGHVFPLRAREGGVLARPGHTEAAVDLAQLAGLVPAGVICEVLDAEGAMAGIDELVDLARAHGLLLVMIDDLVGWRRTERSLDPRYRRIPPETLRTPAAGAPR